MSRDVLKISFYTHYPIHTVSLMFDFKKYTYQKAKRRLWLIIVAKFRKRAIYRIIYKSYWHSKFHTPKVTGLTINNYFSAVPNPGAGIGHQLANWIAGYWFAKQFN